MNLDKFESLWGHGFTRIELPRHIKNVSAYLAKYLGKDTFDSRLYGQKAYFTSRGLKRPEVTFDDSWIDNRIEEGDLEKIDSRPLKIGHFDKYKKSDKVKNNKR